MICHERQVIQQRLRGAKDVDRISSFMMKLEKVQLKYDELEAVVKVVYPEVLPEVGLYKCVCGTTFVFIQMETEQTPTVNQTSVYTSS